MGSVLLLIGHPVAYAPAALAPTQQQYVCANRKRVTSCSACLQTVVETDHNPLIGLQCKDFCKISPRLQRLLLHSQHYTIRLEYIPGKQLTVADALSHVPDPANTIEITGHEHGVLICTLVQASAPKLNEMRTCRTAEDILKHAVAYI